MQGLAPSVSSMGKQTWQLCFCDLLSTSFSTHKHKHVILTKSAEIDQWIGWFGGHYATTTDQRNLQTVEMEPSYDKKSGQWGEGVFCMHFIFSCFGTLSLMINYILNIFLWHQQDNSPETQTLCHQLILTLLCMSCWNASVSFSCWFKKSENVYCTSKFHW